MKVKNEKNPVIMTLIVVTGLLIAILTGLSIKSEATKKKLEKFYNETMSDSKIDANLIAGQEVMIDNPEEAKEIFKEIEDYRSEAKYYLGVYDYSRGNKDAALEKFFKAANMSLKEGMFYAGVIYDERKNYKEAEKWYLKAEKEGLAEATIRLAKLYNVQKNQKKRKEKLLALSKREEPPFMYELGVLYIEEKKYNEAKNLFLKLKEYNMTRAEDRLEDIDEILKNQNNEKVIDEKLSKLGDNISKEDTELIFKEAQKMIYSDSDKVVTYLEKIEKYHPKAAIYLTEYYIYTNNKKKRDEWLLKAAEKGNASAMNGLANIYETDYKDFAEAQKWYKKAAEKNYSIGMTRLGELYQNQGNNEEAKKWYKKAVQKGERSALNNLAVVYLSEKNYKESESLFLRSVKENNFVSMRNLSELYHVQEKYEEAEKLDINYLKLEILIEQ